MKRKISATLFAAMLGLGAFVAFASATYTLFGTATIVTPGNGSAHAAQLTSGATTPGYGGVNITGYPSDPASITHLSFDYNPSVTGNSGGSPRLVVSFSDSGNAQLGTLTLVANTWTTIEGMSSNNWDNAGGTCGYLYATNWAAVKACHTGETITGMQVVNDSGWMYPATGIVVRVDNITVNSDVITFEPPVATSTQQCKGSGWRNFVDNNGNTFNNQGDCVSFVSTHGKNQGDNEGNGHSGSDNHGNDQESNGHSGGDNHGQDNHGNDQGSHSND